MLQGALSRDPPCAVLWLSRVCMRDSVNGTMGQLRDMFGLLWQRR
jgi:hypothetical protein